MTIKAICNREVLIAQKDITIHEAAKLMRDYHSGDIVLVEEKDGNRYPAGIVTDRDIVIEILAKEVDISAITLGDMVCRELIVAKENDAIDVTLKLMRQKGVRRLPVVDDSGILIGIITLDDLIELIAEELKDLAELIGKQQKIEQKYR
jgi:CBS domain-containing protein